MASLDQKKLTALLAANIERALSDGHQKMAQDRATALKYYRGDRYGNEVEGRSQVVSRDVAQAIDGIMPSLMRIFTSSNDTVRFEPRTPAEEAMAAQATDCVNWIWNSQNAGFANYYGWFKDALMNRLGVLKIWWDPSPQFAFETYSGLTDGELDLLLADPAVEPIAYNKNPPSDGSQSSIDGQSLHSLSVRIKNRSGQVRIRTVPPEEFLYDAEAASLEDARFIAHRVQRTASELVAMGYDATLVAAITANGGSAKSDQGIGSDRLTRQMAVGLASASQNRAKGDAEYDSSLRAIWVTECYIRVDEDGDGIAELRQITVAESSSKIADQTSSNGLVILEDHAVVSHPFAVLTPILMPHMLVGSSIADQTADLQLIKSTLLRQMLDNLYLANNPEKEVVEGLANLDDLMSSRPGGIKRVKQPNVIRTLETPFVASATFPMLDYIDTTLEQRTGVSRMNQGLDPDSLNHTATGVNLLANAAMQRIELIARLFAETGVRQAFRRILELLCRHENHQQVLKLRGKWVEMDPRSWTAEWDMTVEVGLGTGTREQQAGQFMQLMQLNEKIIAAQGGVTGPILDWQDLYEQLRKLTETMGIRNPELFYSNPQNPAPENQAANQAASLQPQANGMAQPLSPLQIMAEQANFQMQLKQQQAQAAMQLNAAKTANSIQLMQAKAAAEAEIAQQKLRTKQQEFVTGVGATIG